MRSEKFFSMPTRVCLFIQIYSHANMWETVSCNFNFHTYKSHNTSERLRGIFSKSLFPIFNLWPMVTSIFSQVRSPLHHVWLPLPLGADEQGAGNRSLWQWLWWQWKWFFGSDYDLNDNGNDQCYWKPFSPFSPLAYFSTFFYFSSSTCHQRRLTTASPSWESLVSFATIIWIHLKVFFSAYILIIWMLSRWWLISWWLISWWWRWGKCKKVRKRGMILEIFHSFLTEWQQCGGGT